jgi:hypothetical protein
MGSNHSSATIDEQDVLKIRARLANNERVKDVATDFNLSAAHVSLIKTRKIWKHI